MWLDSLRGARTLVAAAGFACFGSWVVASPSILDQALLGMIPERAEIILGLMSGQPSSFLVMTRSNTTDLTDFQSLTRVETSRLIERVDGCRNGPHGSSVGACLVGERTLQFPKHFQGRSEQRRGAGGIRGLPRPDSSTNGEKPRRCARSALVDHHRWEDRCIWQRCHGPRDVASLHRANLAAYHLAVEPYPPPRGRPILVYRGALSPRYRDGASIAASA